MPARCSPRRTATRCSSPTSPPTIGGDPLPGWLHQRDQLLDDATRELLDQAATFGNEFDARLLAAAVEAPLLDVLALLEAAEAAGLVVPRPGTASGFAFVHALFRSVRYRELPVRRRLLAARPGRGRLGGPRRRRAVTARSSPPCLPGRAGRRSPGGGRPRPRRGPLRRARLRLRRGDRPPRPGARRRPADRAARSCRRPRPRGAASPPPGTTVAIPTGLPPLLDAARRADARGDRHALVRAATAIPQFGAVGFIDPMAEGRAVTEAALAVVGDESSAARAQLLMDLSSHWLFVDVDEALATGAPRRGGGSRPRRPRRARQRAARRPPPPEPSRRASTNASASAPSWTASVAASTGCRSGSPAPRRWRRHTSNGASWRRGPTGSSGSRSCSATGTSGSSACKRSTIPANRAFLAGDLAAAEELVELTVPWSVGHRRRSAVRRSDDRRQPSAAGARRRGAQPVRARRDALHRRLVPVLAGCDPGPQRRCCGGPSTRSVQLRAEGFPIREIYPWSIAVDRPRRGGRGGRGPRRGRPRAARRRRRTPGGSRRAGRARTGPSTRRWPRPRWPPVTSAPPSPTPPAPSRPAATARRPIFLARELVFLAEARRRSGDTGSRAARPRGAGDRRATRGQDRRRRRRPLRAAADVDSGRRFLTRLRHAVRASSSSESSSRSVRRDRANELDEEARLAASLDDGMLT